MQAQHQPTTTGAPTGTYAIALSQAHRAQAELVRAMTTTFPLGCWVRYTFGGIRSFEARVCGYLNRASGELVVVRVATDVQLSVPACCVTHRKLAGGMYWEPLPIADDSGEEVGS